jgi:trehalose 6-phosphate phosphatase
MNYLLDAAGRAALAQFVRHDTLIVLDYDGTLAPIVPHPPDARMRESTRGLLHAVARRLPVVVLSGRARNEALRLLEGAPLLEVIGSHGVEAPGMPPVRFVERVARWRSRLAQHLRPLAGVAIEDKQYSLAVHYRHAGDPAAARHEIELAASQLEGARLLGGKAVVNIVPREGPDKGAALQSVRKRLGCARALFVGDDDTDEDAFAIGAQAWLMTVRVGQSDGSAASWFLRDQGEVDALLEALLAARAQGP